MSEYSLVYALWIELCHTKPHGLPTSSLAILKVKLGSFAEKEFRKCYITTDLFPVLRDTWSYCLAYLEASWMKFAGWKSRSAVGTNKSVGGSVSWKTLLVEGED
jgi:hypothetical protein